MRVKSEIVNNHGVLSELDRSIRYTLLVSGILSGSGAQMIKSGRLQRFCTVRHVITCIVLTSYLLTKLILTWNAEEDKIREVLLMKISTCFWMLYVTVNPCILFLAGHSKWGLEKYYEALVDIEERLILLGAKISYKKIKIYINTVTTLFLLAGLGLCSSRIEYYSRKDAEVSWFGVLNENTTSPAVLVTFNTYSIAGDILFDFIWTFPVAYFVCVCGTQWILLRDFNNHLENSISDNPGEVLTDLVHYRMTHLRLTGLVAQANQIFSPMLGLIFSANVVIVLLMLYILSYPPDPVNFPNYIIWMALATTMTILFIIPCDRVAALTVEANGTLLELLHDKAEIVKDPTMLCQMQMFMNRLQIPESFTAAGMMDINKELGITIIGVLASYYIVLVQFNAAPSELQPDLSSNSTLSA